MRKYGPVFLVLYISYCCCGCSSKAVPSADTEESRGDDLGTPLHRQRGWVPPLLGPLPDDFLRLPLDSFPKQVSLYLFLL